MYKTNAKERIFKRNIEDFFWECKYLFLALFLIILIFKFI